MADDRNAKRTSISLPADVMDDGEERRRALGYRNFSEYIAHLISADVAERPIHRTIRGEQQAVRYERIPAAETFTGLNETPGQTKHG